MVFYFYDHSRVGIILVSPECNNWQGNNARKKGETNGRRECLVVTCRGLRVQENVFLFTAEPHSFQNLSSAIFLPSYHLIISNLVRIIEVQVYDKLVLLLNPRPAPFRFSPMAILFLIFKNSSGRPLCVFLCALCVVITFTHLEKKAWPFM